MGMFELKLSDKKEGWFVVGSEEELKFLLKVVKRSDLVGRMVYPEDMNRSDYIVLGDWIAGKEKLAYLSLLSNSRSIFTVVQGENAFNRIDKMERSLGKDIEEFTAEEVKEYIKTTYNGFNLEMILTDARHFERYCLLARGRKATPWSRVDTAFALGIVKDSGVGIINRIQLKEMFDYLSSPQLMLPILLAYEGVNISTNEDNMEASWIKKEDLGDHTLAVRNKDDKIVRTIELEDWVYKVMLAAAKQQSIIVTRGKKRMYDKLGESDFLIKKSEKINKSEPDHAPYSVIYHRMQVVQEVISSINEGIKLSPRHVAHSGQMYYIDKYMNEGMELKEAVEAMLDRFGDVNTTSHPHSYNRKLKRIMNKYNAYKKVED